MLHWKTIEDPGEIEKIRQLSHETSCLIFKHSTRCSISSMAKMRLESGWNIPSDQLSCFFLDLIAFRNISLQIAREFEVHHESPQVLLIRAGECIYDASHLDITTSEIQEMIPA